MSSRKKEVPDSLLDRYRARMEEELEGKKKPIRAETRDYMDFKMEMLPPHMNLYEKLCNISESILKIKPDKKKIAPLQQSISTAHLDITPSGAASFGILAPLVILLFLSILLYAVFHSFVLTIFAAFMCLILIGPFSNMPHYLAQYWRLKASSQMVLCIFYVVTYMRHTSNIENAIQFASEHLSAPLSLDLKKVVWDVETSKFDTLKDSLDYYLNSWTEYNMEFVESFHLIESSLLESDESRRLAALDRSLNVILEETYEKMLHYAHDLKSPITMLHMLGVILPILGLVILPLVVSFIDGVTWIHLSFIYNIFLPLIVYFIGKSILSKRPTGYGDTDISEEHPIYKKYRNIIVRFGSSEIKINPIFMAVGVGAILLFIGLSPILLHLAFPSFDTALDSDGKFLFLDYKADKAGNIVGPFGLGASVLGIFVTLSLGLGIGLFFFLKSKRLLKIRNRTKQLEDEFSSALFQLGNRLGDDIPAEKAFGKVGESIQNTNAGRFFSLVNINIQKLGMSLNEAIFNPARGAIIFFPSKVIESSMKVLIESVKKGPKIAAQALTNIARYIKEIHRVNERLKDLMADIISSMNSQIKFLTPAIAGIVVGITSMITAVLGKLIIGMERITQESSEITASGVASLPEFFSLGIPTYYFQIVVGIYVVEIIYILTVLSNGIENGSDKLNERYNLGKNMIRSTILYCILCLIVMLLFNFIAVEILGSNF
ncbi:hypothetical protein J4401_05240 [Candidatus Woesearchaeota archaeon]|nr:hypothetical protein [Candidatus Woesearchaeota archaeon]